MVSGCLKNISVSVIGVIVAYERELPGLGIVILVAISARVKVLFDFPIGIERSE